MRKLNFVAVACLAGLTILGGCRPYDVPEYLEIAPNESGFLVQMEGDTSNQMKFDSEAALKRQQVAMKRVQIPHEWKQMGRLPWTGLWQDQLRLITVDRSPITRVWTAVPNNQAIAVESQDGVSLSIDVVVTASITEENAAKFLYLYTNRALKEVMDQEIRGRVQSELSEACASKSLEDLKKDKGVVISDVRTKVVDYFVSRGVQISSLGLAGGFTYENPEIQKSIDKTFQDQQRQISAKALQEAQTVENETLKSRADAEAEAAINKAKGEAAAIKLLADAKKYETTQATNNPMYITLRALEVQQATLAKWDGKLPQFQMGSAGQMPQLLMQLPQEAK